MITSQSESRNSDCVRRVVKWRHIRYFCKIYWFWDYTSWWKNTIDIIYYIAILLQWTSLVKWVNQKIWCSYCSLFTLVLQCCQIFTSFRNFSDDFLGIRISICRFVRHNINTQLNRILPMLQYWQLCLFLFKCFVFKEQGVKM